MSHSSEIYQRLAEHVETTPVWKDPAVHGWPMDKPGVVFASSVEELPDVYNAAVQLYDSMGVELQFPEGIAEHELQHFAALSEVALGHTQKINAFIGLLSVRHSGLTARRLKRKHTVIPATIYQHTDPNTPFTPIEMASIAAHPDKPSATDIRELQGLGFSNIATVREAIKQHNRTAEVPLLMPRG